MFIIRSTQKTKLKVIEISNRISRLYSKRFNMVTGKTRPKFWCGVPVASKKAENRVLECCCRFFDVPPEHTKGKRDLKYVLKALLGCLLGDLR